MSTIENTVINMPPLNDPTIIRRDGMDGFRWSYCYLHGEAEDMLGHDVFVANKPMPTEEGAYMVEINGKTAIAVIAKHYGILSGRVALLSDKEALEHALNESEWR